MKISSTAATLLLLSIAALTDANPAKITELCVGPHFDSEGQMLDVRDELPNIREKRDEEETEEAEKGLTKRKVEVPERCAGSQCDTNGEITKLLALQLTF